MSINITRNENPTLDVTKIVPKKSAEEVLNTYDVKQPRDAQGRFTSGNLKLEKLTDEKVSIINDSKKSPINMKKIINDAPFVGNFLEDNGLIKEEVDSGHVFHAMALVAYEDSYYLFFRRKDKFGFHLNCGNLEGILNSKDVNNLIKDFTPLDWEVIQKA